MKEFKQVAKTYYGMESVLARELTGLGADDIEIGRRMVSYTGDKALMYRANLSLRTAIRILKPIKSFSAKDADEVYDAVKDICWEDYMTTGTTFSIDATVNSENFRHSKFVAYRTKDAIVDRFMERENKRPSVRQSNPDLYINVHISHDRCTVSLDSSGESLHRRGYRNSQNEAPISEALAAGMLLMADWDGRCDFVDPMCGSGTFLIEAALIALNIPPAVYRRQFAFEKWNDFDSGLFDEIYNDDSCERDFTHKIYGYDINKRTVEIARQNVKAAGLQKYIEIECRPIADFMPMNGPALMVTNPPYGERIISDDLFGLYKEIGTVLKHRFIGNSAWVISSHVDCLAAIGMKPSRKIELKNGELDCEFWKLDVFSGTRKDYVIRKNREKKRF
ncbi:MAG: class I SAM-dependent RNA methyltransferase [Candidatus Aphodosoma sp.]